MKQEAIADRDKIGKDKIILKTDMHLHSKDDPKDYKQITYSTFELIDDLDEKDFDVFSVTLHDYMFEDDILKKIRIYAKSKGMLFIPGLEKTIEEKHILIYNMKKEHAESINNYEDLKKITLKYYTKNGKKDASLLVVAAHPFFMLRSASGKNVFAWSQSLDAIEYNSFYLGFFNPNLKAIKTAKHLKKVMVGNTDAHILKQIGNTYTQIYFDADDSILKSSNDINKKSRYRDDIVKREAFKEFVRKCSNEQYKKMLHEVIQKIKSGQTRVVTKPLKLGYVLKTMITLFT